MKNITSGVSAGTLALTLLTLGMLLPKTGKASPSPWSSPSGSPSPGPSVPTVKDEDEDCDQLAEMVEYYRGLALDAHEAWIESGGEEGTPEHDLYKSYSDMFAHYVRLVVACKYSWSDQK